MKRSYGAPLGIIMRLACRLLVISTVLVLTFVGGLSPVLADSGSYTDANGTSCTWFGSGTMYSIDCSGGMSTGYSCDLSIWSRMMSSWSRRDRNGATWTGSR